PLVQAPTLIVARRDARFHRASHSEYLAKHIPHAKLRMVEGADSLPFHAGDFGPTLDAVEDFLIGRQVSVRTERVLATVLFTDIVGSTVCRGRGRSTRSPRPSRQSDTLGGIHTVADPREDPHGHPRPDPRRLREDR